VLDRRALLELVPDLPRWVQARGMLLAGAPAGPAGAGWVVSDPEASLLAVIGDADPAAVLAQAAAHPEATLLCAIEDEALADALAARGWRLEAATLFTLPDPATLPDDSGAGRLPVDADLSHLPAPLAAELARALGAGGVHSVQVDGAPVSFAYAAWRTARWFDLSVDTLAGFRQLGLGARVAAARIRAERVDGREPVWGAAAGNLASRRLAERLGFSPSDAIRVASPPA
jgi:hypothetical protein